MIYELIALGVTALVLGYVCAKQYKDIVFWRDDAAHWHGLFEKFFSKKVHLLMSSRVAKDGRLIVPRKVYENFKNPVVTDAVDGD